MRKETCFVLLLFLCIYSKYTGDANSGAAPPYAEALKARTEKYIWPDFLGKDTDSGESLEKLSIPGLWIFSDNDPSIPVSRGCRPARSHEPRTAPASHPGRGRQPDISRRRIARRRDGVHGVARRTSS